MDQIYMRARMVLICIHDPRLDYGECVDWIKSKRPSPEPCLKLRRQLGQLLGLRYFSRVWVIQEVALAKTAVLIVNEASVLLSARVLKRLHSICQSQGRQIPGPLQPLSGLKGSLLNCLDATRHCSCTDPRDKVYAILSLVEPRFRKLISINYTKESYWVFSTVAVAAIVHYQNLDILSRVGPHTQPGTVSWIPEWRPLPPSKLLPFQQFEDQFQGSWRRDITLAIRDGRFDQLYDGFSDPKSTVQIRRGRGIDPYMAPRLQVRAHLLDFGVYTLPESAKFYRTILKNANKLNDEKYRWILRFFRKTFQNDIDQENKWTASRDCALGDVREEEVPDYNLPDLISFIQSGIRSERGACIFMGTYSVGFANGTSTYSYNVGDEQHGSLAYIHHVTAIDGAKTPFILRCVGKSEYEIVGECYLWAALDLEKGILLAKYRRVPRYD